eukprot:3145777-Prymnesium_polylepis.1
MTASPRLTRTSTRSNGSPFPPPPPPLPPPPPPPRGSTCAVSRWHAARCARSSGRCVLSEMGLAAPRVARSPPRAADG